MNFSKAMKGFLINRSTDLSPNTVEIYTWALKIMGNYFGEVEIDKLTKEDMHKFFEYLTHSYVPARRNKETGPLAPRSMDHTDHHALSIFQIGLRFIERRLTNALPIHIPLSTYL
jgi:hypothetical protein